MNFGRTDRNNRHPTRAPVAAQCRAGAQRVWILRKTWRGAASGRDGFKAEYDQLVKRSKEASKLERRLAELQEELANLKLQSEEEHSGHERGTFVGSFRTASSGLRRKNSPSFMRSGSRRSKDSAEKDGSMREGSRREEADAPPLSADPRSSSSYWTHTSPSPNAGEEDAMRMARWDARGESKSPPTDC